VAKDDAIWRVYVLHGFKSGAELSSAIVAAAKANYGYAGRLTKADRTEVRRRYAEYCDTPDFSPDGALGQQSEGATPGRPPRAGGRRMGRQPPAPGRGASIELWGGARRSRRTIQRPLQVSAPPGGAAAAAEVSATSR
jgi:hypothetical protein